MKTNRHTMELTDEERELILAYRQAGQVERRNIRVLAFMKWEPNPGMKEERIDNGRIVAINTARSFRGLR